MAGVVLLEGKDLKEWDLFITSVEKNNYDREKNVVEGAL